VALSLLSFLIFDKSSLLVTNYVMKKALPPKTSIPWLFAWSLPAGISPVAVAPQLVSVLIQLLFHPQAYAFLLPLQV
jgi:hypothetical protein